MNAAAIASIAAVVCDEAGWHARCFSEKRARKRRARGTVSEVKALRSAGIVLSTEEVVSVMVSTAEGDMVDLKSSSKECIRILRSTPQSKNEIETLKIVKIKILARGCHAGRNLIWSRSLVATIKDDSLPRPQHLIILASLLSHNVTTLMRVVSTSTHQVLDI